jgi:glycosyltransferase involved in cell wall biosynthesis
MVEANVCFVVNAVDETSVPADIATAVANHTGINVDILAWFDVKPFGGDEVVDVQCVDAPNSTLGIDLPSLRKAGDMLSAYDLIQTHHNHSGAYAKLLARRFNIPTISREGNMRKGFNRLGRIANGVTNPLAATVVCNSSAVYNSFKRWERALLKEANITFIPNGVDFDEITAGANLDWSPRAKLGIPPDRILIGTAGSLTAQKDHETLIRALSHAHAKSHQPLELCIAGDGPAMEHLETLATELDIRDRVHFLGYVDREQVYKMLSEIDIYAMPSKWEGFSAAAVEAIGAGNPTVFAAIPPFTIPYRDIAKFHSVGNYQELASHILELAANPDLRQEMAEAGRQVVKEKYRMETVAHQYRDLYVDVLLD